MAIDLQTAQDEEAKRKAMEANTQEQRNPVLNEMATAGQPVVPTVADPNQPSFEDLAGQAMAGYQKSQEAAPVEESAPINEGQAIQRGVTGAPDLLESVATGALKGVFETKDFFFGDTPPAEQSGVRRDIEKRNTELAGQSMLNGFSSSIGQFGVAMLGLGKITALTKADTLLTAVPKTSEAVKAAIAGMVAFDPHEERMSNMVQSIPMLANPVNAWLAAKPEDSAALGRAKNALESIGMDAALVGVFAMATLAGKHFRAGNTAKAIEVIDQFKQQQSKELQDADAEAALGQEGNVDVSGGEAPATQEAVDLNGTVNAGDTTGRDPGSLDANQDGRIPQDGSPTEGSTTSPQEGEAGSPEVVLDGSEPGKATQDDGGPQGQVKARTLPGEEGLTVEPDRRRSPNVRASRVIRATEDDTLSILEATLKHEQVVDDFGGWTNALYSGHITPSMLDTMRGGNGAIPYAKLTSTHSVDDFMATTKLAFEENFDRLKGGKVQTDADNLKLAQKIARTTGNDPAKVFARVQQAGTQMQSIVAEMQVGYAYGVKSFNDAVALRQLYLMGDYTQFGGNGQLMLAEITKRLSISASFMAESLGISSNVGRALRSHRKDVKWLDPESIRTMDQNQLMSILDATDGKLEAFGRLQKATFWSKTWDWVNAIRINNLVSGPITHVVNLATTAGQVATRPAQRIIGATVQRDWAAVDQNLKQYYYMFHATFDGYRTVMQALKNEGLRASFEAAGKNTVLGAAVKSFKQNDSALMPHSTETFANKALPGMGDMADWKPLTSPANILHDALTAVGMSLSVPTRLLGTTDEVFKQIVYRSHVMANAAMEAKQLLRVNPNIGNNSGKTIKQWTKEHIETRVMEAFDDQGRGIDVESLREANVSTFQQELETGTIGKSIQGMTAEHPALKLVIPFVKTPTNVIREGWRLTPMLNLLQKEYKDMLTGKLGTAAQQQAVGQMAMGLTIVGALAFFASKGTITGGGPQDPRAKKELMKTNWLPYAFVFDNGDGTKRFVPYGRADPIAIPFGIVADLMDAHHNWQSGNITEDPPAFIQEAIGALMISISKQAKNKSYLMGISTALDAALEADDENKVLAFAGSMAQSFVPYSSFNRQTNDDKYMRDARSLADKVMQVTPGLSVDLPAQYNWLGEPVLTRPGLWADTNGSIVDEEVIRLATETGEMFAPPSATYKGVNLRDIVTADGENAYVVYQQLSRKPSVRSTALRDAMAKVISSDAYERAPDGDVGTKGTKRYMLAKWVTKYREAAMKRLKADPNVQKALMAETVRVGEHYKATKATKEQRQKAGLNSLIDLYND